MTQGPGILVRWRRRMTRRIAFAAVLIAPALAAA
jgi:hypothetical protein